MDKRAINTKNAPDPVGPYSQAIASGKLIFCSGQIALDPSDGGFVNSDIEAETTRVMENLKAVLEEAGSSLASVVKTTIFLLDMNDFARVNTIYASYFDKIPPARSTIQAAALPKGARVEIDCIAVEA